MQSKLINNVLSPAPKQRRFNFRMKCGEDGDGNVRKNLGRCISAWSSTMAVDSSISRVAREPWRKRSKIEDANDAASWYIEQTRKLHRKKHIIRQILVLGSSTIDSLIPSPLWSLNFFPYSSSFRVWVWLQLGRDLHRLSPNLHSLLLTSQFKTTKREKSIAPPFFNNSSMYYLLHTHIYNSI